MTDPSLGDLNALIKRWRKEADELDEATKEQWVEPGVKRECADELEAALSALSVRPTEPTQEWQPIADYIDSRLRSGLSSKYPVTVWCEDLKTIRTMLPAPPAVAAPGEPKD